MSAASNWCTVLYFHRFQIRQFSRLLECTQAGIKGLVTTEPFLGCTESAVLILLHSWYKQKFATN